MAQEEGEQFEDCLRALNSLFQKGYTHLFMTQNLLMRKMMNHFTKLGKNLEVKGFLFRTMGKILSHREECYSSYLLSQSFFVKIPNFTIHSLGNSFSRSFPLTQNSCNALPLRITFSLSYLLSTRTYPANQS